MFDLSNIRKYMFDISNVRNTNVKKCKCSKMQMFENANVRKIQMIKNPIHPELPLMPLTYIIPLSMIE